MWTIASRFILRERSEHYVRDAVLLPEPCAADAQTAATPGVLQPVGEADPDARRCRRRLPISLQRRLATHLRHTLCRRVTLVRLRRRSQGIEGCNQTITPEPCAQVRILPGALRVKCQKTSRPADSGQRGLCVCAGGCRAERSQDRACGRSVDGILRDLPGSSPGMVAVDHRHHVAPYPASGYPASGHSSGGCGAAARRSARRPFSPRRVVNHGQRSGSGWAEQASRCSIRHRWDGSGGHTP